MRGGNFWFHIPKILVNHIALTGNKSLNNRLQSSSEFANYVFEESAFCLETLPLEKLNFSSIAIAQAHEQSSAIVKGDDGAILLTAKESRG